MRWTLLLILLMGIILLHAQEAEKIPIAVFNLEAQGIDTVQAKIFTDRIRSELKKTGVYNIMERELMEEILKEQAFQLTGVCSNTSCLVQVGRIIAVRQIVGGSIGKVGDLYTIQLRIIDVETGTVVKTVEEDYRGPIELLLTNVTRKVTRKLAGVKDEERRVVGMGNADLYVESDPPGGIIYVDGEPTGQVTPGTVIGLTGGAHTIVVKKEKLIAEQVVNLQENQLARIKLTLAPGKRTLRFFSTPADAEVYVSGQLVGKTPCQVAIDIDVPSVMIEMHKEGYITYKEQLALDEKLTVRVNRELEKAGTLVIASQPPGASVFVDNLLIGKTPLQNNQISLGQHSLKITMGEDYYPVEETIQLSESERTIKKSYVLKKREGQLLVYGLPAGAVVQVDDKLAGTLPKLELPVKYGNHEIKVSKKGFHVFRKQIQVRTREPITVKVQLKPKSKASAIVFSALFPGGGQFYSDRKINGFLMSAITLGLFSSAYITHQQYNDAKTVYEQSVEAYLTNTDLNQMTELSQQMVSNYDDMKQKYDRTRLFIGLGVVAYLYNIIDNAIFFPEQSGRKLSVSPEVKQDQMTINMSIHF